MTHLYLIRHADYTYDLVNGKYPRRDLGLTPDGVKQAEHLRERLAGTHEIKPDVFISSTERSAYETAKILAPALGLEIVLDKEFEEWHSEDGSISEKEFMKRWEAVPVSQRPYHRYVEGCENRVEFVTRVHMALNHILQEHAEKTIVAMTHGAFIQTSFAFFFGYGEASLQRATPEIRRTSITHWYKPPEQERWILERSNDYQHLL